MALQGAGGTPGGIGSFFFGFLMAVAGGWLLTNQVTVQGGDWSLWGYNSFGLSVLPFVIGAGLLFFDGKSIPGWLLFTAGIVIVLVGVIVNLRVWYRPTSLFNTLLMLVLLAGGIGLMARALRASPASVAKDPAS